MNEHDRDREISELRRGLSQVIRSVALNDRRITILETQWSAALKVGSWLAGILAASAAVVAATVFLRHIGY